VRARLGTALAAVLLVGGCASGSSDGTGPGAPADVRAGDSGGRRGTANRSASPLPDETCPDTAGHEVVPAQDASTPVTLVFFGYTSCPDICNVVLANIASALRGATEPARDATRLMFVSTDPGRDTPEVVRDYLDRFDPTYEGLVAPPGTVEEAAAALHVSFERADGSTGGYEVDHGTHVTAFLDGSARVVWSETTPVEDIRADLERLARLA
jgi:protein SCO1/2